MAVSKETLDEVEWALVDLTLTHGTTTASTGGGFGSPMPTTSFYFYHRVNDGPELTEAQLVHLAESMIEEKT